MIDDALEVWTVYDHPRDFPETCAARLHLVRNGVSGATDTCFFGTLEQIRVRLVRMGKVRLERNPSDDPVIVETWI